MFDSIFVGLFLSLALGAFIGSQREMKAQQKKNLDFAGFRTYSFVSMFGFLISYISYFLFSSELLFISAFLGVVFFSIYAYGRVLRFKKKDFSIISVVSLILTFFVGSLVAFKEYHLSITISVIMTFILLIGEKLHFFAKKLTKNEIFDSLKFAIMSFVILPFLPNINYSLLDIPLLSEILLNLGFSSDILIQYNIFNPYKIWLVVVFISGISYFGYLLMKFLGAGKGIVLTGFLGGLVSSTASMMSFSIESKKLSYLSVPLAVGAVIASSTMFFRILFEVLVVNNNLLFFLFFPFVVMGTIGIWVSINIYNKNKLNHTKEVDLSSPFSILPAIEFTLLFVFILFLSKLFVINFGSKGIYFLSFFSGLTDVDAIVISLSSLSLEGSISERVAGIGILIASISNTFVKAFLAFSLGSLNFRKIVLKLFSIILISGVVSFIIFLQF